MNLKESYRYSNYLEGLLNTAYMYINNRDFITTTKQTHLCSKANPDASDEIIDVQKPYDVEFTPTNVVDFVVKILGEKERLAEAVAKAKATTEINIDNAISMNKKKQSFVRTLNNMADAKSSETKGTARGYKFDINGEQKPYTYDTVTVKTIDYNRNNVKALAKKFTKDCDEVSAKLDAIEINTQLDFEPAFDITDKFEDLVG
jgi:hypothetical protein